MEKITRQISTNTNKYILCPKCKAAIPMYSNECSECGIIIKKEFKREKQDNTSSILEDANDTNPIKKYTYSHSTKSYRVFIVKNGILTQATIKRMFKPHGPYQLDGIRLDFLQSVSVLLDINRSKKSKLIGTYDTGAIINKFLSKEDTITLELLFLSGEITNIVINDLEIYYLLLDLANTSPMNDETLITHKILSEASVSQKIKQRYLDLNSGFSKDKKSGFLGILIKLCFMGFIILSAIAMTVTALIQKKYFILLLSLVILLSAFYFLFKFYRKIL